MSEFTFYTLENATGEAKETLQGVQDKYGFIPNLFGYMAEAPYTIDAYGFLDGLLEKTDLTPAQRQIGLLTVANYHECGFCRVAHQAFSKMSGAKSQTVQAILAGTKIEDAKDRTLVETLLAIVEGRGAISEEQLNLFFDAGFSRRNVYDLILIATIKTLSNYSNHINKPEPNEQLLSML